MIRFLLNEVVVLKNGIGFWIYNPLSLLVPKNSKLVIRLQAPRGRYNLTFEKVDWVYLMILVKMRSFYVKIIARETFYATWSTTSFLVLDP